MISMILLGHMQAPATISSFCHKGVFCNVCYVCANFVVCYVCGVRFLWQQFWHNVLLSTENE